MRFSESLKKNKDFQLTYKKGKSYANRYLVMYVRKNGTSSNRLGLSVSKKVGEQCGPPPGYTIIERKLSTSGRLFPAWIWI